MTNDKPVNGGSQNYSRNGVKRRRNDVESPCRSSAADDTMTLELATPNGEAEILRLRAREVRLMYRICELEEELEDVKACIRAPGSEQAMLRTTISNLQRMLQVHNRSIDDFKALETDSLAFQTTPIEMQFSCLYLGVYDTAGGICDLSSSDDLPEKLSDISELSDMWAKRAGGTDFSDLVASAEKVKVPKMELLASIQTAGIFHLVFESAFPDILATESPMLDQYRKIIAGAGGRELLLKIELAATKSLFSEPNIKQHMISENVKCLCSPMLKGLKHFMPLESQRITQPSSSLTEKETMALTNLEDHLSEALSFKLELALSVKRFRYFFFKPGTPFDAETMQYDIMQGRDTMTNNGRLKICIFPALYSVPGENGEREQEMESSFGVNHQGLSEARMEDLKSLVLVAKARVLL